MTDTSPDRPDVPDVPDVIVSGHICLDLILEFESDAFADLDLESGALVLINQAKSSTGGVVANTGLALHRLGVATSLMAKVGEDLFGQEILRLLRAKDPQLVECMRIDPDARTSFTAVVNPVGKDHTFLHLAGANDSFGAEDVSVERLSQARLFHFGYPPIMKRIRQDGGHELKTILQRVREAGLTTSLDMCSVDPSSEAGRVDWRSYLGTVLPEVDLFVPSIDELLAMMSIPKGPITRALLHQVSGQLLDMGAAIVLLKLGDQGLFLRTTPDPQRLETLGRALAQQATSEAWLGCEMGVPAFQANVVGTTGAGDSTIAGFIGALLKGYPPRDAITFAAAVGAFCVEQSDAASGIPPWNDVTKRLQAGWPTLPGVLNGDSA
ncbi:MAG: carbohydrate kinase family protein [Planctomycetes bacterium]|nr:carbohydrate kinase family protein [Planctomycetota bacterium]